MSFPHCLSILPILFGILGSVGRCAGAKFDAKTQFAWVDSSCDSVIDQVNAAGDDYNSLVSASITNLESGDPSTDLGKATLLAYFGTPVGVVVDARYRKLQSAFATLELYCDGTAFEWVTTYQEGKQSGQPVPENGQWHTKEGRYNPAKGPFYLSGKKTDQRTNICQTPEGKNAQGVSTVGKKHIVLCPDAFNEPVHGSMPNSEQTIGISLDDLTSTGAVLLHEATHCILSTVDLQYKVSGALLLAKISNSALKNADTWMYYAMASLLNKNAWVLGIAQAPDNFGPKAPKTPSPDAKRERNLLQARRPQATPNIDHTTLITLPRSLGTGTGSLGSSTSNASFTFLGFTSSRSASANISIFGSSALGVTGSATRHVSSSASSFIVSSRQGATGLSAGRTSSASAGSSIVSSSGQGITGPGTGGNGSASSPIISSSTQAAITPSSTGAGSSTSGFSVLSPSNPDSTSPSDAGSSFPGISSSVTSSSSQGVPSSSSNSLGSSVVSPPSQSRSDTGTTGAVSTEAGSTAPSQTSTTAASNKGPIPTVILGTIGGSTSLETFSPTTYAQYQTLRSTLTTNMIGPGGITFPAIIGPGGLSWQLPTISPGDPIPNLPAEPPSPGGGRGGDPPNSNTKPSNQRTSNQPSATRSSAQSTPSSSPVSCTNSQIASDCSVICAAAATSGSTASASQSCSTTCYSTFQACSATGTTVTSTASASASSGEYNFETPAIYSEVSDTIPYKSVSAVIMGEFLSNSITDGVGASASSTSDVANPSHSSSLQTVSPSQPASQALSPSQSATNSAAPSTSAAISSAAPTTASATPAPSTPAAASSTPRLTTSPPAFSCVPM